MANDTTGQVNAIINSTVSGNQKAGGTVNRLLKNATTPQATGATGLFPAYKSAVTDNTQTQTQDVYKPKSALEINPVVKFDPNTNDYTTYQMPGKEYGYSHLGGTPTTANKLSAGHGPITNAAFNDIYHAVPTVSTSTAPVAGTQTPPTTQTTPVDYQKAAESQVDADIAKQNAGLDLQIKQAKENQDFETAQSIQAYKDAMQDMRHKAFISDQATIQNAAARGLLGASGLSNSPFLADMLMRSGMATQEQARKMYADQQATAGKNQLAFNQLMERINQSKQDLASGRASNIEKTKQQLIKDQSALDQMQIDQKNKEWEAFQNAVISNASASGQDLSPILPMLANRDKEGITKYLSENPIPLNAKTLTAQEQAKFDNDIALSKRDGRVYIDGKPLEDKQGNPVYTLEYINQQKDNDVKLAELKLHQQQAKDDVRLREQDNRIAQQNANISAGRLSLDRTKAAQEKTKPVDLTASQKKEYDYLDTVTAPYFTTSIVKDDPYNVNSPTTKIKKLTNADGLRKTVRKLLASGSISKPVAQAMFDNYGITSPLTEDELPGVDPSNYK